MEIKFWGTRGSLAAPNPIAGLRKKLFEAIKASNGKNLDSDEKISTFVEKELPFTVNGRYGNNTSCIQVIGGESYILCDAGTGLRDFALELSAAGQLAHKNHFSIFMSHLHWDHIQGFPFFIPVFIPGNTIDIYSCHSAVEEAFRLQQKAPTFPVPFDSLMADINFHVIETDKEYEVAGVSVKAIEQNHPGKSYGYSFSKDGKKAVYSTDSEHKEDMDNEDYPFIEFFKDADLLAFDAQYTHAEAILAKEDWGHSSNLTGVELASRAGVKTLYLFHHEPTYDDWFLAKIEKDSKAYANIFSESSELNVIMSYDGLKVTL